MRSFKKVLALALSVIMIMSFAACHKKGEIAVTLGDVEFTSAYYMCALMNADTQAKQKVTENLSQEVLTSGKEINYYTYKVEDTDYVEWVEKTALDDLKERASYKLLCKENGLVISDEQKTSAQSYADYYWNTYGYSQLFELNGVGYQTYTDYMIDMYYYDMYFEHLYGAEGEKAIAADDVKTTIYDNFVIANVLDASYTVSMTKQEKTEYKAKLDGYVTALKDGSRSFKDIYNEFNEIKEDKSETTTEDGPKDKYATILGTEDTSYAFDYYDDVKNMAVGEVKLLELKDDAGYMIFVKQDIKADEYYLKTLDSAARHLIADEEYDAEIQKYLEKLTVDVNNYAVGQFKVKKIKEPESTDQ